MNTILATLVFWLLLFSPIFRPALPIEAIIPCANESAPAPVARPSSPSISSLLKLIPNDWVLCSMSSSVYVDKQARSVDHVLDSGVVV